MLWHPTSHAQSSSQKIIELTPEQMKEVLNNVRHSDQVKVRYAVADQDGNNEEVVLKSTGEEEEIEKDKKQKKKKDSSGGAAVGEFLADLASGLNGHDGVLILFAVVGAVITIVWIASIPYTAYKALTGEEKYNYVNFLSLGHARIISRSPQKDFDRSGEITSLKYNFFFRDNDEEEDGTFHTGLAAELGHYQLRDKDEFNGRTNYLNGNYWLLGPSAMIGFRPNFMPPIFYKLDLTGGTSFRSDVNLIARADFAVMLELSKNLLFGPNISANYIDIEDNKGITSGSHPDYLLGLNLGYKF